MEVAWKPGPWDKPSCTVGDGGGHLGGEDRLGGGLGQEDFIQEADARLVRKPSPESSSQVVLGFCLCRRAPTPPTA